MAGLFDDLIPGAKPTKQDFGLFADLVPPPPKPRSLAAVANDTVIETGNAIAGAVGSIGNFIAYIQNTDPGSNAGIPGLQIPVALGAASKLPVGLELDGPAGSDRRLIAIGMALEELFGRLPAPKR